MSDVSNFVKNFDLLNSPAALAVKANHNYNMLALCGGGMDSFATILKWLDTLIIPVNVDVKPRIGLLFIDYGQRTAHDEREAVLGQKKWLKETFPGFLFDYHELEFKQWDHGQGTLVVDKDYVPYRNLSFVIEAAKIAEIVGYGSVGLGVIAAHAMGEAISFRDTTPQFIVAAQEALNWSAANPVQIYAPYVLSPKFVVLHELVENMADPEPMGIGKQGALRELASITYSCYHPNVDHTQCGECSSCQGLKRAFVYASLPCYYKFRPIESEAPAPAKKGKKK